MDVRPGGVWEQTMHGPDGSNYPNKSVFVEVTKPERIVFTHGGGKEGGPGAHFESTWTFDALGDRTRVTIRMVFASAEERNFVAERFGAIEGGNQTLARLDEFLGSAEFMASRAVSISGDPMQREITLTRLIDAPRALVYEAWVNPERLQRWWGPRVFTNPVCEVDARVGGKWRIVMRGPDGADYPCGGEYREIIPNERLVFTNSAIDKEGKTIIDGFTTVTFADQAGKTKLTLQTRGTAMVNYAAAYLKGMEAGWSQSLDKLVEQAEKR